MGRPTKYSQEMVTKAQHYLDHYQEEGHKIPSQAGLALALGLSRETLRIWSQAEDKKEFLGILERINQKQECLLLDGGLDGTAHSTQQSRSLSWASMAITTDRNRMAHRFR